MFEFIQAGLLRDIVVPSDPQGGIGSGFRAHLVPTQSPSLQRDPTNADQLALSFAARMEDTTVATVEVDVPNGPNGAVPVDPFRRIREFNVTSVNATMAGKVTLRPRVSSDAGVYLEIVAVELGSLTGQLRAGPVTTELSAHRQRLQTAITAALRARAPKIPLVARSIGIVPPFRAVIGQPAYGTALIAIPVHVE